MTLQKGIMTFLFFKVIVRYYQSYLSNSKCSRSQKLHIISEIPLNHQRSKVFKLPYHKRVFVKGRFRAQDDQYFLSFPYLTTYFTILQVTEKYEKREKYLVYCTR